LSDKINMRHKRSSNFVIVRILILLLVDVS
jgi:hypothetical protein